MRISNVLFSLFIVMIFANNSFGSITITNTGDGSGTIKLYSSMPPRGTLLDSCELSSAPSSCSVGVNRTLFSGDVIQAVEGSNSFFGGWSDNSGSVGSCGNSSKTCNITGSSNGSVKANFTQCTINLTSSTENFRWRGGDSNFEIVTNHSSCQWTATTNVSWINITSSTSGSGSTTLYYTVSKNTREIAREGIITVGNKAVIINQSGYDPYISISPDTIEFGTVRTRIFSERKVIVRNIKSSTTVNINSVQVTGDQSSIFSVAHNCNILTHNESCLIRLAVNPQSSGAFSGTLVIESDDPHLPSHQISISGTGNSNASTSISISPNSISFTNLDMEFGNNASVNISNTGTGSIIIDDVFIVGKNALEFVASHNCAVIPPGSSCNLAIGSQYTSSSPKEALLIIKTNSQNTPIIEIPITAYTPLCMNGVINLTETSKVVQNAGASLSVPVTITGDNRCMWVALSSANWLSANLSSTELAFTAQANNSNLLRMSNIRVGGEVFTVIQHKNANNTTFNDIAGNYFADYINAIYSHRITIGCIQDVSYCPLGFVTRGEMAAFIIRALQGEGINYTLTPYYTDVPANHNFFKYVQKMRDLGITVVTGEYRINDRVTRGEMAAFIIRAIFGEDFSFTQVPYFSDVPSNHTFFKYVQKMRDMGITVVTGIYRVDDYVTRQEMAAFIARAFLNMR